MHTGKNILSAKLRIGGYPMSMLLSILPQQLKHVIFHHSIGRFYQDFWEKIQMTIRMIRPVMIYAGYSGKL